MTDIRHWPELDAEVAELKAEIERLRGALEYALENIPAGSEVYRKLREALKEKP